MMRKRLPPLGLIGERAIREAFAGDYRQLEDLLRGALRTLFKLGGEDDPWPYVRALFDDAVVVEKDGKLWRYPYTVDGTQVTLGTPTEVMQKYVPAEAGMREGGGAFLETVGDKAGARYRIRVIKAGLSGNSNFYPDAVLREAVPLFDGVRVFVKADEDHLAGKGKDVRNLVGRLAQPRFVEGARADEGEIQAVLELIEPEGPIAVKIREAWKRGMTGLFGFSIDAVGSATRRASGGREFREATSIRKVKSVDLIVEPGAGGQIIELIESKREVTIMDREEVIKLIEASRPDLLKGKKVEDLSDDDLKALLREAVAPSRALGARKTAEGAAPKKAGNAGDSEDDETQDAVTREDLDATVRMVEARAYARASIAESGLPEKAKARLRQRFNELAAFTEADVDKAIQDERDYIASFVESGRVTGLGDFSRIESGETRADKVAQMLDAFFDPNHRDHRHAQSFRECYVQITGDRRVTGMLRECDEALLRESLDSTSFANVLGDSITRRMIADYRTPNVYDVWRQLVGTPVPANDFRTQERTRYGGYGDLPIVNQKDPYQALASPTDEKATYAVKKRGGTEDVTLEMIKNDDVGAIRQIPIKLSRAAKRTLAKFVLDFIRTNPTIYDGLALFHATHGNLGSAALDATSFAAGRLAMLKQTELNSADRIGIGPRDMWVPPDLEETAVNLFRRNTNQDKTFIQSLSPNVIPVWYWTDTNDWAISADPMDVPTIEIGFLDGNQEPELFVQDSPTVGSMFSHDKLTWKIRHIYGGNVLDYRGLYKAVVA